MQWKNLDGKEFIECSSDELRTLVVACGLRINSSTKNYRVVCPRCLERNNNNRLDYTKRHLSISGDLSQGYCFRCDGVFKDKLSGLSGEVDTSYNVMDAKLIEHEINTKPFETAIPLEECEEGTNYIKDRNPYYNITSNQFDLKCKSNKIFIPYKNLVGKVIYYQIRYLDPEKSPTKSKYYNPPVEHKPIYIAPHSTGEIYWNPTNPSILVEGALTAIALKITVGDDVNVIGAMGKVLTSHHLTWLFSLGSFNNLFVMMDSIELSIPVSELLTKNRILNQIIPSEGQDAEECLVAQGLDTYRAYVMSYLNDIPLMNSDIMIDESPREGLIKQQLDILNRKVSFSF